MVKVIIPVLRVCVYMSVCISLKVKYFTKCLHIVIGDGV